MIRLLLTLFLLTAPAFAQAESPLLMEGKTSLYQRVLIRESGPRFDAPDGTAGEPLAPLSAFYVYERRDGWLRLGAGDQGGTTFWAKGAQAVDWEHNIVAMFEGGVSLPRLLFFDSKNGLYDVVESENPSGDADNLRASAEQAETKGGGDGEIVALGPEKTVDSRQNLYVIPILESEEALFDSGAFTNLLRVAVANAENKAASAAPDPAPTPEAQADGDYKAAVVFVVDTTTSMAPYIAGTRQALKTVYGDVARAGLQGQVSFGLVGFRDNVEGTPDLEYAVRTFVPLEDGQDQARFDAGIEQMKEAQVSSKNFREDSFAGVSHALRSMNWAGYDARYIVLVTDASPRDGDDPLSSTGLSARGLGNIVQEQLNGVVAVMHLRTDDGQKDHDRAETAYRELARQPNADALYFPIEYGSPEQYQKRAADLARLIVAQVDGARSGDDAEASAAEEKAIQEDPGLAAAVAAGRAMRLAYLGRKEGARAPDVFEAWVADRDFSNPALKPLSIRVLLSKPQLSDLEQTLDIITRKAEENAIDPDKFFDQVLGAAADMSRRPDSVSRRGDESFGETLLVGEYLEDLPYKSRIMTLTRDDWVRLSTAEQIGIVNELYDKLERYRRYNEASDQWVDYLGTGEAQALLYPMRLEDLP